MFISALWYVWRWFGLNWDDSSERKEKIFGRHNWWVLWLMLREGWRAEKEVGNHKLHLFKKHFYEKFVNYHKIFRVRSNAVAFIIVVFVFVFVFFFGHAMPLVGSYFPDQGLNPGPWQWKCWLLTTGPTGNSLILLILAPK